MIEIIILFNSFVVAVAVAAGECWKNDVVELKISLEGKSFRASGKQNFIFT